MPWWPGAKPRSGGAIWGHLVKSFPATAGASSSCVPKVKGKEPLVWHGHCSTRPAHHPSLQRLSWGSTASLRQPPQGEPAEHGAPCSHVFEAQQHLPQFHQPSSQVVTSKHGTEAPGKGASLILLLQERCH